MRGLTDMEREALSRSLPGADDLEWYEDSPEAAIWQPVHEQCTRLGWMDCESRPNGWDYWRTTKRGRVALELDALVRASEGRA